MARAPGEATARLELASLELCDAGERDRGETLLGPLLGDPGGSAAERELAAQILSRCGDPDAAVTAWLDLIRREPGNAWLYRFRVGQLYYRAGRYRSAVPLLERALRDGPEERAELPAQLGAALARLGRTRLARGWLRDALGRSPSPELAARIRGQLEGLGS